MSIESVRPSSHLILCRPLLFLPPIPPSIRVFSSESTLHMRWPKYWNFSFSIIPSKEIPGLISFRWPGWISLQSKGLSRVFSNTSNLDYKNQSHNLVTILQKKKKKNPRISQRTIGEVTLGSLKYTQKNKKITLSMKSTNQNIVTTEEMQKVKCRLWKQFKEKFPKMFQAMATQFIKT